MVSKHSQQRCDLTEWWLQLGSLSQTFQAHAKQSLLFIVLLSCVAASQRPLLDSDGSLRLRDYVRDLKAGLGRQAADSMGAAWAFTSQGCVRVCVCVCDWAGWGCVRARLCVQEATVCSSSHSAPSRSLARTFRHEPVLLHTGKNLLLHVSDECVSSESEGTLSAVGDTGGDTTVVDRKWNVLCVCVSGGGTKPEQLLLATDGVDYIQLILVLFISWL